MLGLVRRKKMTEKEERAVITKEIMYMLSNVDTEGLVKIYNFVFSFAKNAKKKNLTDNNK